MNKKHRSIFIAVWLCCIARQHILAQDQSQPLHLELYKPHELRDLAVALQMREWLVTFEEGPVLSAAELETKTSPTGLTVLVRRTVPVTFDVGAEQLSAATTNVRAAVIRTVLAQYASAGYKESYRILQDGRYLHIVPATIPDGNGNSEAFEPLLDTRISFPEQRFQTLHALVDEVLNQVAEKRGVPLVVGAVPNNLFRQSTVVEVANDEPARDVLGRAFFGLNGPRLATGVEAVGLPWTLSYDPTDRQYWFSVNAVQIEISGVNKPKNASINAQDQGQTGSPRPNGVRKVQ